METFSPPRNLLCLPKEEGHRLGGGDGNRGLCGLELLLRAGSGQVVDVLHHWALGPHGPWKGGERRGGSGILSRSQPNPTSQGLPVFIILSGFPSPALRLLFGRGAEGCGESNVPTLGRILICPPCFLSWVDAVDVFMLNMGSRRVEPR